MSSMYPYHLRNNKFASAAAEGGVGLCTSFKPTVLESKKLVFDFNSLQNLKTVIKENWPQTKIYKKNVGAHCIVSYHYHYRCVCSLP